MSLEKDQPIAAHEWDQGQGITYNSLPSGRPTHCLHPPPTLTPDPHALPPPSPPAPPTPTHSLQLERRWLPPLESSVFPSVTIS